MTQSTRKRAKVLQLALAIEKSFGKEAICKLGDNTVKQ